MGGCCCSSRKAQFHGTPVYYYCPPILEEQESLTSHDSASTLFSSGLLVDLNIDMSSPDTYRPPPAPIPYDVVLGSVQSNDLEARGGSISPSDFGGFSTSLEVKESDCTTGTGKFFAAQKKIGFEHLKENDLKLLDTDEEDVCPTCLEDYDAENPKIVTGCHHHFHLSCILEWMERSDTCPICNQEMKFEAK